MSAQKKLGVLGIGLVMEEVGKGARLVFRYPSSPPPYFSDHNIHRDNYTGGVPGVNYGNQKLYRASSAQTSSSNPSKDQQKGDIGFNGASDSINLFFDLPARVLSKLFRPKRALCGQPLTLNVSETTFCCRAELFDNLQSCPATDGGSIASVDGTNHALVLFSVIIALAPLDSKQQSFLSESSCVSNSPADTPNQCSHSSRIDSAFTTIECVHRNLARLCRVLTREELRCQYVTLQCQMLLSIRKECEETFLSNNSGRTNNSVSLDINPPKPGRKEESNSNNTASRVLATSLSNISGPQIMTNEKRPTGASISSSKPADSKASTDLFSAEKNDDGKAMSPTERREYVQQLIELMLAASPPLSNHGNLARELTQVFHFLSKHDDPKSPVTPSVVLSRVSGRDGVIYINRHVAVPLDPIDDICHKSKLNNHAPPKHAPDKRIYQRSCNFVRPYHTLLFSDSSPSEILRVISDDNPTSSFVGTYISASDISPSVSLSHIVRRMLTHLHPRKSLQEVALDSALPLTRVLEAAEWLVDSRICKTGLPVSKESRFKCVDGVVGKMRELALPFWQAFSSKCRQCHFQFDDYEPNHRKNGAPHIFLIVSALTSANAKSAAAPKLGDVIDSVCGESRRFQQSKESFERSTSNPARHERLATHGSTGSAVKRDESSSEDVIYSMAVWLLAQKVITQVKEYLVALKGVQFLDVVEKSFKSPEEVLFHELLDFGYLSGTISTPAICHEHGIDKQRMDRFIEWGQQRQLLKVVCRVDTG